jgi:hypothetical protein
VLVCKPVALEHNAACHLPPASRKYRSVWCMGNRRKKWLTFDFERRPLEPSIQTYSAMTLPL